MNNLNENENLKLNIDDYDLNKASFYLLLEAAARLRIISTDISIIRIATINGIDDLQENINKEKQQAVDDFKKTQYELLAEVFNKSPKQNDINRVDELQKKIQPALEGMLKSSENLFNSLADVIKKNSKDGE